MKLCYIDENWAYFTTRKLCAQWGDDWNDAPYEHNAGEPYEFHDHDKEKGQDPWIITKVAWEGDLETPADKCGNNSRYSVEQINGGVVAWLSSPSWVSSPKISIPAGVSLEEFKVLVELSGGNVYIKAQ